MGESKVPYVVGLLGAALVAYGLSRLADMTGADSVGDCIALGAYVWASFAAVIHATQIAFSKRPSVGLFAIEGGYQLVSFIIIGAIVGAFQ